MKCSNCLIDHLARLGFARQKAHRHGIAARLRQGDTGLFRPVAEQGVGDLDEDTGAIPDQGICPHRAAMVQVNQELQALADNFVGLFAFDIGDKADAARIMFVARIVQALFRRKAHHRPNSVFSMPGSPIFAKQKKRATGALLAKITRYVITRPVAAQHDRCAKPEVLTECWGKLYFGRRRSRLERIMNRSEKIAGLRHFMARYGLPDLRPPVALGHPGADAVLGGGLHPGVHEVFARDWCAGGFAAALAIRAASSSLQKASLQKAPLFWVRPDYEGLEYGGVSAKGLLELGGDPARLVQFCAPNAAGALSAAADILSCPHVGALLLEIGDAPKCLDLVASRRLALAAAESGVTVVLLRPGANAAPSAALTRWQIGTAPSLPGDDWGSPRLEGGTGPPPAGRLKRFHDAMGLRQWGFSRRRTD